MMPTPILESGVYVISDIGGVPHLEKSKMIMFLDSYVIIYLKIG